MNSSVIKDSCACCSCMIDKSVRFQYIFNENEFESEIQKLIFECIGKNVTYIEKSQQIICVQCLQQLNQITKFKQKCLASRNSNGTVKLVNADMSISSNGGEIKENGLTSCSNFNNVKEYSKTVKLDNEETSSNINCCSLDECEDYEVLEDFIEDDISLSPLKYVEQIEYQSIKDVFKDIEFEDVVLCSICDASLVSHTSLIKHIMENHVNFDSADSLYYPCNVEQFCSRFNSLKETNEHILQCHYSRNDEMFNYVVNFKCLTCNSNFLNKAAFGKHVCVVSNLVHDAAMSCSVCSGKFKSRNRMNFHFQFHLEHARPKICLICLKTFNTESDFYNHVMFFHESSEIYECSYCDQTFSSNQLKQNHEKNHSVENKDRSLICKKRCLNEQLLCDHTICAKNKLFKCHVCGKFLHRASRLRKHIASHEKPNFNTIFSCEICDRSYAADNYAMEHIKTNHNIDKEEASQFCSQTITDHVFCCEYCSKLFRTSKCLNEHRTIHDGIVQPYECEFCSSTYDSFSKLRTHKIVHEKHKYGRKKFPVQKLFLCRHNCDKSYLHWPDLSHHMNAVHLAKAVACEICNKSFPYRWNYLYHKKTEHMRKLIFMCNVDGCAAEFNLKKDYIIHKKLRHSEVKIKTTCRKCKRIITTNQLHECCVEEVTNCDLCEKSFQTINALKTHIRVVHERVINHYCEYCNRGFYNISDKNIHLRIHTQEKPYQCNTCLYECRTQSTLTEHMRTHTNERPYICPYPKCGAKFRRSYAMKTHFKIHSGERNFKCTQEECTKKFRSNSQLNYHLKKKHWSLKVEQTVTVGDMFELKDTNENISIEYDVDSDIFDRI